MPSERSLILSTLAALFFFVAGVFVGKRKGEPPPTATVEANRPAVQHDSGALTLERIQPTPRKPAPRPLDLAPGTTTTTHSVTLELAPSPVAREIQMDIQEGKDGTRVTVEGPGILSGQDFTIPRPPPPSVHKWTVGAAWDGKSFGPMVSYQWQRMTVGGLATRNQAAIFAGIRF